jgi:preprotein translocase subunit SecE
MERIKLYLNESYNELINNVTWPTWENLYQTAMVVLGSSAVVALLIFIMDAISNQLLEAIYKLG